jgi:L-threonylcarbamoyladenylate synthase
VSSRPVSGAAVATAESQVDADVVLRAAEALRAGEIVAIPTDTVYGLAAAIDRPDAIRRLYVIKGRPAEKAIPVLIAEIEDLQRLTPRLSSAAAHLARTFWPGALTLVLPALADLPQGVTTVGGDGMQTVAVRVPDSAPARAIIAAAGGALAVTSANRSGAAPAVEAHEVSRLGLAKPLLIVDGGRAPGGVPSTIVAATTDSAEMLREGAIPATAIAEAVADIDPVAGAEVWARYDQRMMEDRERSHARETSS